MARCGYEPFSDEWLGHHIAPEPNTGCWIYLFPNHWRFGYGKLMIDGVRKKAHHVFYEHYVGPIPAGLCVLHKCDFAWCVNPAHLEVGTQLENIRQRHERGRSAGPRGERHAGAKLSDEKVREMFRLRAEGWTYPDIARVMGTDFRYVERIISGRLWRHVETPLRGAAVLRGHSLGRARKRLGPVKVVAPPMEVSRCSA